MSVLIRPLTDADEVNAAFRVFLRAMVGLPLRDVDTTDLVESGRYLGALDGTEVVGGADSYSSHLVVPGGARVLHGAVTHIGVLPTHRRRGIANDLISHQLRDLADRGEVVASLRASEAVIYERYGYGIAGSHRTSEVTLARAALRPGVPHGGQVRLVDAEAGPELLASIYRDVAWTGAVDRPPQWWRFAQLLSQADPTVRYAVVHSTDGIDDGFALYRPEDTQHWFASNHRTVTVTDFVAVTDSARAGLWRHLFALDLVDVLRFESVALDDPLPLALQDRRAITTGPERDETWLRLVDVGAALSARTYGDQDHVVVEVLDTVLPGNTGRYDIGREAVTRTSAAPDVTVDVATLATTYLGGTRWRHLDTAGRLLVHTPGAVRRLDQLFDVDTLPYAGTSF